MRYSDCTLVCISGCAPINSSPKLWISVVTECLNFCTLLMFNYQFVLRPESHHFSSSFDHNLHCLKKDNLCLKLGNSYPLPPGVKSIHLRPVATPCAVFIKICLISIFWREIARSLSFWHAVPVLEGERGWNNALWLLLLPLMSITSNPKTETPYIGA